MVKGYGLHLKMRDSQQFVFSVEELDTMIDIVQLLLMGNKGSTSMGIESEQTEAIKEVQKK